MQLGVFFWTANFPRKSCVACAVSCCAARRLSFHIAPTVWQMSDQHSRVLSCPFQILDINTNLKWHLNLCFRKGKFGGEKISGLLNEDPKLWSYWKLSKGIWNWSVITKWLRGWEGKCDSYWAGVRTEENWNWEGEKEKSEAGWKLKTGARPVNWVRVQHQRPMPRLREKTGFGAG